MKLEPNAKAEQIGGLTMPILNSSGMLPHKTIVVRTRLNRDIDNIQPWHYAAFEWTQLDTEPNKYIPMGAIRVGEFCPIYNCHGLTFASRRTQVDGSTDMPISRILEEDGYTRIPDRESRVGDVVIYRDTSGIIQHSGIVVGHGDFKVPRIWSKWGKACEMVHPLGACTYSNCSTEFYRITKWKVEEVFQQNS